MEYNGLSSDNHKLKSIEKAVLSPTSHPFTVLSAKRLITNIGES